MSGWREQGMGLGPISHQEILAWSILYHIEVSPSEVDALKRIDMAFRIYENDKMEQQRAISADAPNKPRRIEPISSSATSETAADIEQAKRVLARHKAKQKGSPSHGR